MIAATLLEALREKDLATWRRFDELELAAYKQYDDYGTTENYIYQEDLIEPACLAWMQAVLQEACQVRGWSWRMQGFPEIDDDHPGQTCCTIMRRKGIIWYDHKTAYGASPAEALLAAYLGAIG